MRCNKRFHVRPPSHISHGTDGIEYAHSDILSEFYDISQSPATKEMLAQPDILHQTTGNYATPEAAVDGILQQLECIDESDPEHVGLCVQCTNMRAALVVQWVHCRQATPSPAVAAARDGEQSPPLSPSPSPSPSPTPTRTRKHTPATTMPRDKSGNKLHIFPSDYTLSPFAQTALQLWPTGAKTTTKSMRQHRTLPPLTHSVELSITDPHDSGGALVGWYVCKVKVPLHDPCDGTGGTAGTARDTYLITQRPRLSLALVRMQILPAPEPVASSSVMTIEFMIGPLRTPERCISALEIVCKMASTEGTGQLDSKTLGETLWEDLQEHALVWAGRPVPGDAAQQQLTCQSSPLTLPCIT